MAAAHHPSIPTVRSRALAKRPPRALALFTALVMAAFATATAGSSATAGPSATAAALDHARILASAPTSWDPARQGDQATASVLAQVQESLTAIDAQGVVQPALAASWSVSSDGRQVRFGLRPGLTFSDGAALTAVDVVRSWLRLLDPAQPSPLASLLDDVAGAAERLAGRAGESAVGIHASGTGEVVVDFQHGAGYFPAAAASPSLAVVPRSLDTAAAGPSLPAVYAGSGAYVPIRQSADLIELQANSHYWAGRPPIATIELVTDLHGKARTDAFEAGQLDYVGVSDSAAGWIRYDARLGPELVSVPSPSVLYYGFDTRRAPFADARVRRAFAMAIDWRRLVRLASPLAVPASSLVPPSIPGRPVGNYTVPFDPDGARAQMAAAGFPGGRGFPAVTLDSGGLPFDIALAREWGSMLGVSVHVEARTDRYFEQLATAPPQVWALDWVADYPSPNDFLGLLLRGGSATNYSGWREATFDGQVAAANESRSLDQQRAHYEMAARVVQQEVPVIPLSYGTSWALVRAGLLGAGASSLGIVRLGGLSWGSP